MEQDESRGYRDQEHVGTDTNFYSPKMSYSFLSSKRMRILHMGLEYGTTPMGVRSYGPMGAARVIEQPKMSVVSEHLPGSGCRLRTSSVTSKDSNATPPNQLKGGVPGPIQRPRPCRLCLYCCCSCSCLAVKTDDELNSSNRGSNNDSLEPNGKPSLEEIESWAVSFDKLMRSSAGRNIFRDFLRSEYAEENILFWLACEELKNESSPEEVEEKARLIYEEFISILSAKEVSLDARVRNQVNRSMVAPTPHTFDEAQQQIYTLMHRDSYPRFVSSRLYRDYAQQTGSA